VEKAKANNVKVIKDFIRKIPVYYLCLKEKTKIVRHAAAPGALNPYRIFLFKIKTHSS
jgi:hypothetical protein